MRRTTSSFTLIGLIALACIGVLWIRGGLGAPEALAVEPGPDTDRREAANAGLPPPAQATEDATGRRDEIVAETAQPNPQRATLRIQVMGLTGPAAGALVVPHRRFYARRPTQEDVPREETPPAEFATDANGELVIEVAPRTQSTLHFTWPESRWHQQITAKSQGHGETSVLKVRFPLAPEDASIQVRSFPTGNAIEGARVTVGSASAYTLPRSGEGVISNELGTVGVPNVGGPTEDPYRVSVSAKGHTVTSFVQAPEEAGKPLTVWLTQHAKLSGIVALTESKLKEGHRPHGGVYLIPEDARQEPEPVEPLDRHKYDFDRMMSTVRSGVAFDRSRIKGHAPVKANGSWELPSVEFSDQDERLEDHILVVISEGHGRLLAEGLSIGPGDEFTIDDAVLAGPPLELDFVLASGVPADRAGTIRLMPGDDMETSDPSWKTQVRAAIGPKGRASIPSLSEGSWRWELPALGSKEPVNGTIQHSAAHPLPHSIVLTDCVSIKGHVDGASSVPISVYWRYADSREGSFGLRYTDGAGDFRIPIVALGRTVDLIAIDRPEPAYFTGQKDPGPDWGRETVTFTVGDEGVTGLVLKLAHRDAGSLPLQRSSR